MHSEIQLDVHLNLALDGARRRGEIVDGRRGVQRDSETHMLGEGGDPPRAQRADGRVREQDVVGDLAHHLSFMRGSAGESDGATAKLLRGEARGFVGFDVRPQCKLVLGCITSGAVEVTLEPIEIDDRDRRLQLGKEFWHGRSGRGEENAFCR